MLRRLHKDFSLRELEAAETYQKSTKQLKKHTIKFGNEQ